MGLVKEKVVAALVDVIQAGGNYFRQTSGGPKQALVVGMNANTGELKGVRTSGYRHLSLLALNASFASGCLWIG